MIDEFESNFLLIEEALDAFTYSDLQVISKLKYITDYLLVLFEKVVHYLRILLYQK